MAEKLETRSELFWTEIIANPDFSTLGYSQCQNEILLTLKTSIDNEMIQFNFSTKQIRTKNSNGQWTKWSDWT